MLLIQNVLEIFLVYQKRLGLVLVQEFQRWVLFGLKYEPLSDHPPPISYPHIINIGVGSLGQWLALNCSTCSQFKVSCQWNVFLSSSEILWKMSDTKNDPKVTLSIILFLASFLGRSGSCSMMLKHELVAWLYGIQLCLSFHVVVIQPSSVLILPTLVCRHFSSSDQNKHRCLWTHWHLNSSLEIHLE